jgi:hypothetical protein
MHDCLAAQEPYNDAKDAAEGTANPFYGFFAASLRPPTAF